MTDQFINDVLGVEDSGENDAVEPKDEKRPAPQSRLRTELVRLGHTLPEAQIVRETNPLSDEELASGEWVKLIEVDRLTKKHGITVKRFMRAFGGDRGMMEPEVPYFTIKWRGRVRYLPAKCLTEQAMEDIKALSERSARKVASPSKGWDTMNKAELVSFLQGYGIEHDPKVKKADLVALLVANNIDPDAVIPS